MKIPHTPRALCGALAAAGLAVASVAAAAADQPMIDARVEDLRHRERRRRHRRRQEGQGRVLVARPHQRRGVDAGPRRPARLVHSAPRSRAGPHAVRDQGRRRHQAGSDLHRPRPQRPRRQRRLHRREDRRDPVHDAGGLRHRADGAGADEGRHLHAGRSVLRHRAGDDGHLRTAHHRRIDTGRPGGPHQPARAAGLHQRFPRPALGRGAGRSRLGSGPGRRHARPARGDPVPARRAADADQSAPGRPAGPSPGQRARRRRPAELSTSCCAAATTSHCTSTTRSVR